MTKLRYNGIKYESQYTQSTLLLEFKEVVFDIYS